MFEYKLTDENLLLQRFELGQIYTNCYLVADKEAKELAVVDPAGDFDVLQAAIDQTGCEVKYIFNTHGHWDHVGANAQLREYTGAPILIHKDDAPMLKQGYDTVFQVRIEASAADKFLEEGQTWSLGRYNIEVLHTPGHTKGGVSLVIPGQLVFSGDTLFQLSIGRTDLLGGSFNELMDSIRNKLFKLPDELLVFSGHGAHTYIGEEKKYNPFLN